MSACLLAAVFQRHAPAARVQPQHVLVVVVAGDQPAGKGKDFVVDIQAAAVASDSSRIDRDHLWPRPSLSVWRADQCAEAGVVGVQAGTQMAHEVLDLVDRDRVADPRIDPAALVERAATVDADHLAFHVEERPAGVAGIDRGVDLNAIGVFQEDAGRRLIAVHAARPGRRSRSA